MYTEKLTANEVKNIVEAGGAYTYVSSTPDIHNNRDRHEHETIANVINNRTKKEATIILADYEISKISDIAKSNFEYRHETLASNRDARKINKALVQTLVAKHGDGYVTKAKAHREHSARIAKYNIDTAKKILENLNYSDKDAKQIELTTEHQRNLIQRYTTYLALEKELMAELEEAAQERV